MRCDICGKEVDATLYHSATFVCHPCAYESAAVTRLGTDARTLAEFVLDVFDVGQLHHWPARNVEVRTVAERVLATIPRRVP